MIESSVTKQQEVMIKLVLDAWQIKVSQLDKIVSELSDEQLMKEVAFGRNWGISPWTSPF